MYIDHWVEHGLPICFMSSNYDDRAFVRTLISRQDLSVEKSGQALRAFAKACSAIEFIDSDLPELEGWRWHTVVTDERSDPQPPLSILDDEFLEKATKRFESQFGRISKPVNAWIDEKSSRNA